MRIAIKNEWPKESNCKRSKAKNCTINKTMAETVERQMEREGIQEKIGRESERERGAIVLDVCFILCDFDMQLMRRERESWTFLRATTEAKVSFKSVTTTWQKLESVTHT